MKKNKICSIARLCLLLILALFLNDIARSQRQQPPEYKEVAAAVQLKDAAARLKELERIKTAYPNAEMMEVIDLYILSSKIELADTLDAVLDLQKGLFAKAAGPQLLQRPYIAATQILQHPKLKTFDRARVTTAILKYRDQAIKAAADPATLKGLSEAQQRSYRAFFVTGMEILAARAQLNSQNPRQAMAALESYRAADGTPGAEYFYTLAETEAMLGKTKEAYEAYLSAAAEDYEDAKEKAKALYIKINGKPDGFEAQFEAKIKALPYQPEPYQPGTGWKGKAVLAELFTGSECPPCVGADLGFDGLIESYPSQVLIVLEYHLPIPRPDPMMNPSTKKREDYYGVNSTPTVVIDGDKKMIGGGSRSMAGNKYKEYKAEIDGRVNEAPALKLKLSAARNGDLVKVDFSFDKIFPGAEYYAVLVQDEEKYRGANGIQFHKHVVRDLATVNPASAKQVTFDLAKSEQATDLYLTDFEKTYTRIQNFKFAERHAKIDRRALKVVLFAQERDSQKVLNAVMTDVR